MFRATALFSMICVFAQISHFTFPSTSFGQEISAADVILNQQWSLSNGDTVTGMLASTSPNFVTVLATTKQYKIRRDDLSETQKKTVAMLDKEVADLSKSMENEFAKWQQNPDPAAIQQYQATKVAATAFSPKLTMVEQLVRLGLIHQAQLGLGPIIRSGKRQYFAPNGKLYISNKMTCRIGKDGIASGIMLEFYPDGSVHELRYLDHEVTTFNWTFFPDGTIKSFTTFRNGVEEGIMLHFHPNAELLSLATTSKGKLEGDMLLFDENENDIAKFRFVDGSLVATAPVVNDKEKILRLYQLFIDLKANVFRETWNQDLK